MLINHINQRQQLSAPTKTSGIEFLSNFNTDILPFSKSHSPTEYAADVTVDPLVDRFELGFRIYADNMPSHLVLLPVQVVRH